MHLSTAAVARALWYEAKQERPLNKRRVLEDSGTEGIRCRESTLDSESEAKSGQASGNSTSGDLRRIARGFTRRSSLFWPGVSWRGSSGTEHAGPARNAHAIMSEWRETQWHENGSLTQRTMSRNMGDNLHLAAYNCDEEFLRLVLEQGADPSFMCPTLRRTPLHTLVGRRHLFDDGRGEIWIACYNLLMRYGANVNAQDSRGRTPLDYANNGSFNTCPIVPLLLRAGAELPAGPIYNRYLSKVKDAGGIERYERAHLASRAATFIPKLAHLLPPELVRHVVEYWMHAGDY